MKNPFRPGSPVGHRAACSIVGMASAASLLGLAAVAAPSAQTDANGETPAGARHVALATKLAGRDLTPPLFMCQTAPVAEKAGLKLIHEHQNEWLPPTQVFDNLYFIGTSTLGVYILKTSAGLILFDSGTRVDTARDHIVPGLKDLGLNPKDVKYVVITHGHADHFGGASYWKETAGAHILASKADWRIMEKAPADLPEIKHVPAPSHDQDVTDGEKLSLGDTTVTLFVTPGHTPGTLSAMIPVRDGDHVRVLSLLGGTNMAAVRLGNNRVGGQVNGERSMRRLADLAAQYHAVGLLNTHTYADGGAERMEAIRSKGSRSPNPFVIGTPAVVRYYKIMDQCLLAGLARPEIPGGIATPYPE